LGGYNQLLDHIRGHQWFLGIEYGRSFSWEEAVQSWHDTVFQPLVDVIGGHRIIHAFPDRTAADLYLWIVEHRYYLSLTAAQFVGGGEALASFDRGQVGPWRQVLRAAYGLYYQGVRLIRFLGRRLPRIRRH
jgi:hypothetical protein